MATGYDTTDAVVLAYIDSALALAVAGNEAGAFAAANALGRGSRAPTGIALSDRDLDRFWQQIGDALKAFRLSAYETVETGQVAEIAAIETLATTDIADAWRRHHKIGQAISEDDRERLGTRIQSLNLAEITQTYTGLLANRCRWNNGSILGNAFLSQTNSKSGHKALTAITRLQIVATNLYDQTTEKAPGGIATVFASVEYPAGTFTRITFSGANSVVIADNAVATSDLISISIPINAIFWIRQFYSNVTTAIIYTAGDTSTYGDAITTDFDYGAGLGNMPDMTMSGTITNGVLGAQRNSPLAIVGPTKKASVIIAGDSIGAGFGGAAESAPYLADIGIVAQSLPATIPFLNLSELGANTLVVDAQYLFNPSTRPVHAQMLPYCSHLICELGVNDLVQLATSAAALVTRLQTLWALLPSRVRILQTTITPTTTSTDGWVTTANQTSTSAQRVSFNNLIRGGVAGMTNYFEVADALESARDSGKWQAPPAWTDDGTHPNAAGYTQVVNAGAIDATKLTYP